MWEVIGRFAWMRVFQKMDTSVQGWVEWAFSPFGPTKFKSILLTFTDICVFVSFTSAFSTLVQLHFL